MKLTQITLYNSLWEKFIKNGSQKALSQIYMDFYDLLFNYGFKHTHNIQIIEDSIQNIFCYFLKTRKNLMQVNNLFGYLIKSFRNQLFTDIKKQNKYFPTDLIPESCFDYFRSHEQIIIEQEEFDFIDFTVKKSISRLPYKQQEIMYLRFDCGLSYEDISVILEISIDSCHKTTYRAIKAIREEVNVNIRTELLNPNKN
jgi:RNA polymerase sigma factor (sigma-70 family)